MFNEVKNVLEWCQTKNRLSIKRQKLQKKKEPNRISKDEKYNNEN